jgi:hypothetical protein
LKQIVHSGPLQNAWIIQIDILSAVKDVVGFSYETIQKLRMKKQNVTKDGFREFTMHCILLYEGAVAAILLHDCVLFNQVLE